MKAIKSIVFAAFLVTAPSVVLAGDGDSGGFQSVSEIAMYSASVTRTAGLNPGSFDSGDASGGFQSVREIAAAPAPAVAERGKYAYHAGNATDAQFTTDN